MTRKERFISITILSILISFILALGHVFFGTNLGDISTQAINTIDNYVFFLSTAFLMVYSLSYFIYSFDISETLAVITTGAWALYFGLEDIFVYVILGYFRDFYPWLKGTTAGFIPTILGVQVTNFWLFYNVILTGVLIFPIVYALYRLEGKKWKIEL